jgi:hypothetical protein
MANTTKTYLDADPTKSNPNNNIVGEELSNVVSGSLRRLGHDIFYQEGLVIYTDSANKAGSALALNTAYTFENNDEDSSNNAGKPCYKAIMFNNSYAKLYIDYYAYGDNISSGIINGINERLGDIETELDEDPEISIDNTDKVLSFSPNGLLTTLSLSYNDTTKVVSLLGRVSSQGGEPIVISSFSLPIDKYLQSANLVKDPIDKPAGIYLLLTFVTEHGSEPVYVNLSDFIDIYTAKDESIVIENGEIKVNLDNTSKLEVGENGIAFQAGYEALPTELKEDVIEHIEDVTGNPHQITKSMLGLSHVDNTSDAEKVIDGNVNDLRIQRNSAEIDLSIGGEKSGTLKYAEDTEGLYIDNGIKNVLIGGPKALLEVKENIETFKALNGIEEGGVNMMGNSTDGGYIIHHREYTDDVGDSVVEHSEIQLNGVYPQTVNEKIVRTASTNDIDPDKSFRVIVQVQNDGIYVSHSLALTPSWHKLPETAELSALEDSIKSYAEQLVDAIENETYKGQIDKESELLPDNNVNGDSFGLMNCDITAPGFQGLAKWNATDGKWDIYPDKTLTIDGDTLQFRDSNGAIEIAPFAETNITQDTTDYGTTITGSFKTVMTGIFKKIRGLFSLVSGKVDKNGTDSLMSAVEHTTLASLATSVPNKAETNDSRFLQASGLRDAKYLSSTYNEVEYTKLTDVLLAMKNAGENINGEWVLKDPFTDLPWTVSPSAQRGYLLINTNNMFGTLLLMHQTQISTVGGVGSGVYVSSVNFADPTFSIQWRNLGNGAQVARKGGYIVGVDINTNINGANGRMFAFTLGIIETNTIGAYNRFSFMEGQFFIKNNTTGEVSNPWVFQRSPNPIQISVYRNLAEGGDGCWHIFIPVTSNSLIAPVVFAEIHYPVASNLPGVDAQKPNLIISSLASVPTDTLTPFVNRAFDTRASWKGNTNTAGILIRLLDSGSANAGSEVLFDLIYNTTVSGSIRDHVIITGQFYLDLSRTGMVQAGNTTVPVYIFKGTVEGVGNTDFHMWIPSKLTTYFPSVIANAKWAVSSEQVFETGTLIISAPVAAPTETLLPIQNSGLKPDGFASASNYTDAGVGIAINLGPRTLYRFRFGSIKILPIQNMAELSEFEYCIYWDNVANYMRIIPKFSNIKKFDVVFYLDADDNICMWLNYAYPSNYHIAVEMTCTLHENRGASVEYYTPKISFLPAVPEELELTKTPAFTISPETNSTLNNSGKYSVDRPDVWPNATEIVFTGKLRGIRFTGTYSTGDSNTGVQITLGNDTIFPSNIDSLVSYGGHLGGTTNFTTLKFPLVANLPVFATSGIKLINGFSLKPQSIRQITLTHTDAYAALTTTYDVWFLYTVV